jgi:hypothetical protein
MAAITTKLLVTQITFTLGGQINYNLSLLEILTSQKQILCSPSKIYRVGYKYRLLRHISQIRDANLQALFGRSNYQPSKKPFLLYVEVVFRSSFLLPFVNKTTTNVFKIKVLKTIKDYSAI